MLRALAAAGRYWMVAMSGALVGRAPVRLTARAAILDTGTTLITCSNADARAINSVRDLGQEGFPFA